MEHQGVIAKFIRVMTNLLLTDNKSVGKMMQCNVKETVRLVSRQHMSHQQIQKAARSFVRALRQRTDDRGISSNVIVFLFIVHPVCIFEVATVSNRINYYCFVHNCKIMFFILSDTVTFMENVFQAI